MAVWYGIAIFGPRCGPCLLGFGDGAARGEVNAQLKNLLGDTGARAVEAMLAGADRHHNGLVAATIASGNVSRCQAAHCRKGQGARHRLRCSPSPTR
jgi:hypothetical protein